MTTTERSPTLAGYEADEVGVVTPDPDWEAPSATITPAMRELQARLEVNNNPDVEGLREKVARIIRDGLDDGMGGVAALTTNLQCGYVDVGTVDLGEIADAILSALQSSTGRGVHSEAEDGFSIPGDTTADSAATREGART